MEKGIFGMEYIKKAAEEVSKNSLVDYNDLPKYDLFLSQVTDYLNDKFEGEQYTNNIIQNYIKSEVISKPEDGRKRGYTKEHLAQAVLLSYMRPILTTEEIKKVFKLAFNEINNKQDDIISWETAHKMFSDMQKESFDSILSTKHFNDKKMESFIKENNLKEQDKERISVFLVVITAIAQASAIKKLAQRIVNEYEGAE